jgi:hypothetical protein
VSALQLERDETALCSSCCKDGSVEMVDSGDDSMQTRTNITRKPEQVHPRTMLRFDRLHGVQRYDDRPGPEVMALNIWGRR